ncbi:hypothetical protein GCM10022280_27280 [Sphingomonas swuensis]|uniref:OmpA-like domain-containing protein n=1 Tax=Sphingomonas swuensis TaxID=977800 RepID=A0ABP7TEE9_9SPHN
MSLVVAATLFMSMTPDGAANSPLGHWKQARAVPSGPGPVNRLHVAPGGWQWNGRTVAEPMVAHFLRVVNGMTPPPLIVLTHADDVASASIQRARQLVDRELACRPERCVEVTVAQR